MIALRPLDGLRVIDVTQMLAGPLAATRFGDLGADVIKIEPPASGEFNRTHGFGDLTHDGEMTTFQAVNRNKRSLPLNLKDPRGLEIFHKLAQSADVVIQNFRSGTAERLGIGYENLAEINPGIVYCSISGFGPVGRLSSRPGQDLIVQGYSGSMFSVGAKGQPPVPGALWAADAMTGYQAVIGILSALHQRNETGKGAHVDIDMLAVVLDAQLQELVTYLNRGVKPERSDTPTAHASIPGPYGVYRTSDGWLTLAMSPLPALGEMLNDDWLRSFTAYNDGMEKRDDIYRHIENAFIERPADYWIDQADRHGVWAGPVYDYDDLVKDPHVEDSGLFVSQPGHGELVKTVAVPLRINGTRPPILRSAPRLGADTSDLLTDLGYSQGDIDALIHDGVTRKAQQ